jgi:DNA polymerase-3 subunit delta
MITLITGLNSYQAQEVMRQKVAHIQPHAVTRRDGIEMTTQGISEILLGRSLFTLQHAVIIKNPAANKARWDALGEQAEQVPHDVEIILYEPQPDKRTKTFKTLQKQATIVTCDLLNEVQAATWISSKAKESGGIMTPQAARLLVEYVGTDQWQLEHELEKLLLMEDTSVERIKATIEPTPQASVFTLLDAAFAGRVGEVQALLRQCETLEDPYKLFGLLANQTFQLAVVARAQDKTAETIAKAIGAHPYPIKKLQGVARKLNSGELSRAVAAVATLDNQLKRTAGEPWLLIERALVSIAAK